MSQYLHRHIPLAICCLSIAALSSASPQSPKTATATAAATQSAVIEQTGPRTGDNATRYLNVEGKAKGKYASYGVVRFDAAAIKADLDKKLGAGKYQVKSVTLDLTQSLASFSAAGSVNIYFTPNDTAAPAALKYPYNPADAALKGLLVGACKFVTSPAAPITAPSAGAKSPAAKAAAGVDHVALTNKASYAALTKHLLSGKTLTLVLMEADPNVAATWAGQTNTRVAPPSLVVEAGKK